MATRKKAAPESDGSIPKTKRSITDIIGAVEKNTGIRRVALRPRDQTDYLSTGCLSLDLISGGGYFGGRVIQYYGKSHTGKSSLMYTTAGALHRAGVYTMFFDHEGTTSDQYAARLGFDKTNSSYYRPNNGEETFETIERVLEGLEEQDSGPPQVAFIIDSIATMPASKEQGEDKSKQQALRASMHSKYMGLLKTQFSRKNVAVVAVNQIRSSAGALYTAKEVIPGGNGWEFNTDNLFKVSRPDQQVQVGADIFQPMLIKTYKNKNFLPLQEATVWLKLGWGIDPSSDVIQFLKLTGMYDRPKSKAPTISGLNHYSGVGGLDKTYRSSEDLENTIRQQSVDGSLTFWRACEQMLQSGDALTKYLEVKGRSAEPKAKKGKKDLSVADEGDDEAPKSDDELDDETTEAQVEA